MISTPLAHVMRIGTHPKLTLMKPLNLDDRLSDVFSVDVWGLKLDNYNDLIKKVLGEFLIQP